MFTFSKINFMVLEALVKVQGKKTTRVQRLNSNACRFPAN